MTISEAKTIQKNAQNNSLLKFLIYFAVIVTVSVSIYLFSDYFQKYKSLIFIIIAVLFLAVKQSKIYLFLQRKEFVGIIEYSNVKVEHVKKYASHQAGVTYDAMDVSVLELVVVNENGRKLRKEFIYDWRWGDYIVGHKVCILRFVDRPIVC